ncbi:hypothetical protein P7K49_023959 [Saguinus oedipus]|uniref:Uncharacterized protein n=1 Tax=Saguinus oedipus TaxID=9490 RepID=A0ABQ9UN68_SAGOE|nr:hypothetical protein P7K49_023959 [Saguinus oedipus]
MGLEARTRLGHGRLWPFRASLEPAPVACALPPDLLQTLEAQLKAHLSETPPGKEGPPTHRFQTCLTMQEIFSQHRRACPGLTYHRIPVPDFCAPHEEVRVLLRLRLLQRDRRPPCLPSGLGSGRVKPPHLLYVARGWSHRVFRFGPICCPLVAMQGSSEGRPPLSWEQGWVQLRWVAGPAVHVQPQGHSTQGWNTGACPAWWRVGTLSPKCVLCWLTRLVLDFDRLLEALRAALSKDPGTGFVFSCLSGQGRTTTAMVVAVLVFWHIQGFPEVGDEELVSVPDAKFTKGEFQGTLGWEEEEEEDSRFQV